jgi:hypothetical protein
MKQKVLIGALLVAAILGYIASPYISVYGLFAAIKSGDTYALKRHINFPELKSSLKDEIKSKLLKGLKDSVKEDGGSDTASEIGLGFAALLGPAVVDSAVDAIVTPSGLSAFISDPKNALNSSDEKDAAEKTDSSTLLNWNNVEYAFFTGLTEFEIRTNTDVTLHFSLHGTSWKLDGLTLPDEATRKKRLASMSKKDLIVGYWVSPMHAYFCLYKDGTGKFLGKNATYSFNNNIISWEIVLDNGKHENLEWPICEVDDEKLVFKSKIDDNPTILKKSSLHQIKQNEAKIAERSKERLRDSICSSAEHLVEDIFHAILQPAINPNNTNVHSTINYPYNLNVRSKKEYVQKIQEAIDKDFIPKQDAKNFDLIFKYFNIANVSFDDSVDTVLLVSKKTDDCLFNDNPKIITKAGITSYSHDSSFKLPTRDPVILPEE